MIQVRLIPRRPAGDQASHPLDLRPVQGQITFIRELDVRHNPGKRVQMAADVGQHSPHWANVVKPFTLCFIAILAIAMFLPFVFIWQVVGAAVTLPADHTTPELAAAFAQVVVDERSKVALDWAKTILPSAVGFGSAIIGYYFGVRSGRNDTSTAAQSTTTSEPND